MYMTHPGKRIHVVATACLTALVIFVLLSLPTAGRTEISASATLSSATFSVDEGAQLTITVNGTRSAELQIPETDSSAFEIIQRGRSSQINMINGQFSSAITFTCIVRGYKPGDYTIPPITINADNSTRTTDAIPFEVTAARNQSSGSGTAVSPPSSGSQDTADESAFIRLVNPKAKSYVGEIIPVEVKAYFRSGLRANLGGAPVLVGDGLVMPQLHDQPVQTQETVRGTAYSVLTWQTTLSNIKEGKHAVHLELDATLLIPQRRMSTSVFGQPSPLDDDFFNSVFGGFKEKPMKARSEDMVLEVLPLPEQGRPGDFAGAIGDFSFQVSATPPQVEAGEPLTLTMSVSGTGNFDRVEAPVFPESADWKTYSPSVNFHAQNDTSYSGEKVFEQAIVARNPSLKNIPSLSFSYFDPQKGIYITRQSPPISVTITGKPTPAAVPPAVAPPTVAPTTTAPQSQPQTMSSDSAETIVGLAPLHLETGRTVTTIAPLYKKGLFLAFIALCLAILLALTGLTVYRMREESRPEERRKRQIMKALQDSCMKVEKILAEGDSAAFLAACRATIQHHLGAAWQCQPNAITRADLAAKIPEATGLIEILTMAEQSAYSGCQLNRETMTRYTSTLKTELEKLI